MTQAMQKASQKCRKKAACKKVHKSQNGGGWKAPLQVIWSNPSAQAGPPKSQCTGWAGCSDGFSTDGDCTTLMGNFSFCLVTLTVKMCFLMFRGFQFPVSVYAHCLWSCHRAPLETPSLCLLYTLHSGIYKH